MFDPRLTRVSGQVDDLAQVERRGAQRANEPFGPGLVPTWLAWVLCLADTSISSCYKPLPLQCNREASEGFAVYCSRTAERLEQARYPGASAAFMSGPTIFPIGGLHVCSWRPLTG